MSERIRVITAKVSRPIQPGEEVEIPFEVSPGKTAEIIGVTLFAEAVLDATETISPQVAHRMAIHFKGEMGNVALMQATVTSDNLTKSLNATAINANAHTEVEGQDVIVGAKFQGKQLYMWYVNRTDKVQNGPVYAALAVREY